MAREMYLVHVDPEEMKPSAPAEPPRTFRQKWENYWYHHKAITLIIAVAVVSLVVLLWQSLSIDRADYTLLMVTKYAYQDGELAAMEDLLGHYGADLDGDGKVEVDVINCYMGQDGSQEYYTNSQVFQAHLMAGDVLLFAFEPEYYRDLMDTAAGEADFLLKLPFADSAVGEDGKVWSWKDDPRLKSNAPLQVLPEDLYFCLRVAEGTARDMADRQDPCRQLLENFALDHPTTETTEN